MHGLTFKKNSMNNADKITKMLTKENCYEIISNFIQAAK